MNFNREEIHTIIYAIGFSIFFLRKNTMDFLVNPYCTSTEGYKIAIATKLMHSVYCIHNAWICIRVKFYYFTLVFNQCFICDQLELRSFVVYILICTEFANWMLNCTILVYIWCLCETVQQLFNYFSRLKVQVSSETFCQLQFSNATHAMWAPWNDSTSII